MIDLIYMKFVSFYSFKFHESTNSESLKNIEVKLFSTIQEMRDKQISWEAIDYTLDAFYQSISKDEHFRGRIRAITSALDNIKSSLSGFDKFQVLQEKETIENTLKSGPVNKL